MEVDAETEFGQMFKSLLSYPKQIQYKTVFGEGAFWLSDCLQAGFKENVPLLLIGYS